MLMKHLRNQKTGFSFHKGQFRGTLPVLLRAPASAWETLILSWPGNSHLARDRTGPAGSRKGEHSCLVVSSLYTHVHIHTQIESPVCLDLSQENASIL